MFLTKYELTELTGYREAEKQIEVLKAIGIIHKRNTINGKVLVLKEHVRAEFGGLKEPKKGKSTEPDWDNMYGSRA